LLTIQGKLELAGITLFGRRGEDIVGLYSTDLKEIGFSSREYGFYETIDIFIRDSEVDVEGATLLDKNVND
jgi:hypothetical protein